MPDGLNLRLADGQDWLICPVDDEAAAVVSRLAGVMQLARGDTGRVLYVAVAGDAEWAGVEDRDSAVCRLPHATDDNLRALQMKLVADVVARDAAARGGFLLHGALAELRGSGFIMAGPGSVGKSTASRRLPKPWRSLCDDTTLVVRDPEGKYRAHPWPTWSNFHVGAPGEGTWPVERAVPLNGLFFLSQTSADRVEPVGLTQAVALVLESAVDFSRETYLLAGSKVAREACAGAVDAAQSLAETVPCRALELSLDGRFWELVEQLLPKANADASPAPAAAGHPASCVARAEDRMVYTGMSMLPTLVEPELLELTRGETGDARAGDVVCFRPPGREDVVVHRVISVEPGGFRTRGDSCRNEDPWLLPRDRVIGIVRYAQRGARLRPVTGGSRGLAAARRARLNRSLRNAAGLVPRALYRVVLKLGPLDRLLPRNLRPRLARYNVRGRVSLKLLMGRRVIGRYDYRRKSWQVPWQFRPFVDEGALARLPASVFPGGGPG